MAVLQYAKTRHLDVMLLHHPSTRPLNPARQQELLLTLSHLHQQRQASALRLPPPSEAELTDYLALHNLRLCAKITNYILQDPRFSHLPFDELLDAAMGGLHRALARFDPVRLNPHTQNSYKLSSFAFPWIYGAVLRQARRLLKAGPAVPAEFGDGNHYLHHLPRHGRPGVRRSLDPHLVYFPPESDPILRDTVLLYLNGGRDVLSPKHVDALAYRLGLFNLPPLTFREAAQIMGCTHTRVEQLYPEALGLIRADLQLRVWVHRKVPPYVDGTIGLLEEPDQLLLRLRFGLAGESEHTLIALSQDTRLSVSCPKSLRSLIDAALENIRLDLLE